MESAFEQMINYITAFWSYFRNVVDIVIVGLLFYWAYSFLSNTRAVQLFKGLLVFFIVALLSNILKLETLNWLINNITIYGVILIMILFQPELRRLLTQFGQRNWLSGGIDVEPFPLDELANSIVSMAEDKIGALIIIERNTGLRSYVESGVIVDSAVTEEMIRTILE